MHFCRICLCTYQVCIHCSASYISWWCGTARICSPLLHDGLSSLRAVQWCWVETVWCRIAGMRWPCRCVTSRESSTRHQSRLWAIRSTASCLRRFRTSGWWLETWLSTPLPVPLWWPLRCVSVSVDLLRISCCRSLMTGKGKGTRSIAVCNICHCCWNSHAIWDHTVLPAARQRWHSHLCPSRS